MTDILYSYEIIINDAQKCTGNPVFEGNYSHKPNDHFINIPVSFNVAEGNAYIKITDSDSEKDRIMSFSADEIRDTLRKVYLYHLLHFGNELIPQKITLIINNEEFIFDNTTPNFPFMFSMISIPSDFKLITFEEDLIMNVIKESKSKQFRKDEYACLYAFLGGLGKEHYTDQFIYFWTAINSYYNLVAKEYNKKLSEYLTNNADYQSLFDYEKKAVTKILSLSGDEKNMHALSLLYSKDPQIIKAKPTRLYNNTNDGANDQSADNNTIIIAMSTWFYHWNDNWDGMLTAIKNPGNSNRQLIALKRTIFDKLRYSNIDAYAWVTFKFPYLFRCNSIHGSRAYLAFAGYDEPELKMVMGMCYAMRDFLNENIKNIFKKELLTDNDFNKIKFMCANYLGTYREPAAVQNFIRNN